MAGIYGVFLKNLNPNNGLRLSGNNLLSNEYKDDHGIIGRAVLKKLSNDRFLKTQDQITICFEGINLSDHLTAHHQFFDSYKKKGISFIDDLKGSYSGFVYDAKRKKIFVFNDHLSTKNIFYYFSQEKGFVFSSELNALASFLRENKLNYSLDEDGVYMMALYGFLLEDHTYIREVKKLSYSSLIIYDIDNKYFKIEKKHAYTSGKKEIKFPKAIGEINKLMEASVAKIWNKNEEYFSGHLSFLSGGMDARTNIIIAKNLGFKNIRTITFGQSNSKDVQYAQNIASGEKLDAFQRFLDYSNYLIDDILENYIKPNDGLMMFQTSAHSSSTVKSFNLDPYPLIHTGQIGDLLFGSFTKENFDFIKNRASIGYTGFVKDSKLLDKIEALPAILKKYQDLGIEIYTYEQRVINATLTGDRSLNNVIDNYSPFFDRDLINRCISLPDNFKKNQMIYFDWLKKYHPRALNYRWDKTEMKPDNKYKITYGKLFKKYFNGAKKYFGLNYDSMNPYHTWLKNNQNIIQTLDTIFNQEIKREYISAEMKQDLKYIYNHNIFEFRNKFAVITALLSMNLYFNYDK